MHGMRFASMVGTLMLAGCASYGTGGLSAGMAQDEVIRSMGTPTGRYDLGDGRARLEYARGPAGRHTYMVDVDAQGRVQRWAQVLDEPHFKQVAQGMRSDELLRLLGRPAEQAGGGLRGGQTWSWRYPTNDCLWFQVSLNDDGRVREPGGYAADPSCQVAAGDIATPGIDY